MVRKLEISLLALALVTAGCLGMTEEDDETLNATADAQEPENGTESPAENHPPANVSLSANTTSGAAPLAVAFELEATDRDGDRLEWTLDPGDDSQAIPGEGLPATVNHTYDEPGNFTAHLVVEDGDANATAEVPIDVAEAEPMEGGPDPQPGREWRNDTYEGHLTAFSIPNVGSGQVPPASENQAIEFDVADGAKVLYLNLTTDGGEMQMSIDDPNCDPGDLQAGCETATTSDGEASYKAEDPASGTWQVSFFADEPLLVQENYQLDVVQGVVPADG